MFSIAVKDRTFTKWSAKETMVARDYFGEKDGARLPGELYYMYAGDTFFYLKNKVIDVLS